MKNRELWFRARRYGWGWTPITWQGWAILLLYWAAIIINASFLVHNSYDSSIFVAPFLLEVFILTIFFLIVCYKLGETPAWHWGEKNLDVLDEHGAKTGTQATRGVVHDQGLWHRAVHVYILNSKGEILLQNRSSQNNFRPGRWYLSTGGHIVANETSREACVRLACDELGLSLAESDFELIGTVTKKHVLLYGTYHNNEFDDIFIVHKDIAHPHISRKARGEISRLEWFPIVKFTEAIEGNDPDFVNYEGIPVLMDYLSKHHNGVSN